MPKKRKLLIGLSVVIVLAAVAVGGYYWWYINQDDGPPAFAKGNGRVEADLVDVALEIIGRVAKVHVQEGDLVAEGDVLAHRKRLIGADQRAMPLFLSGTFLYLFAAAAIGILLGTAARSMAQFALLLIITILPMMILSGGMSPVESAGVS